LDQDRPTDLQVGEGPLDVDRQRRGLDLRIATSGRLGVIHVIAAVAGGWPSTDDLARQATAQCDA
jgi:hypothetical protein